MNMLWRRLLAEVSIKKIQKSCEEVCAMLKALSHPQRLMVLGHLLTGEKSVTELVEACGVSQPQMSQFLMRMKNEGLIVCRRDGRFQYYSVGDERLVALMKTIQYEYCER